MFFLRNNVLLPCVLLHCFASTKCCSSTLFSSDSLICTRSTNVTLGLVYFLACQCCLLLRKISTKDVPIVSMSWIIIYANCIFSLYDFPSTHFEDDDECNGNLIANGWIFNASLCALLNSSFTYVLLNNFFSSSCLCMCSLFYASFPLVIHCSFSNALSAIILCSLTLLWTLKLWKHTQLPTTNVNCFLWLPYFSYPWTSRPSNSFFICPPFFN
jgi:hypothetical protein